MEDTNAGPIEVTVEDYLEDLIPAYLEHRRDDIAAIREALATGDLETARSLGHQMKGSGGGYGFDGISEIGEAMEAAAKAGDVESVRIELDSLIDYLDRLVVSYE